MARGLRIFTACSRLGLASQTAQHSLPYPALKVKRFRPQRLSRSIRCFSCRKTFANLPREVCGTLVDPEGFSPPSPLIRRRSDIELQGRNWQPGRNRTYFYATQPHARYSLLLWSPLRECGTHTHGPTLRSKSRAASFPPVWFRLRLGSICDLKGRCFRKRRLSPP